MYICTHVLRACIKVCIDVYIHTYAHRKSEREVKVEAEVEVEVATKCQRAERARLLHWQESRRPDVYLGPLLPLLPL